LLLLIFEIARQIGSPTPVDLSMHLECGWKQVGERGAGRHVGPLTSWPSHGSSKRWLDGALTCGISGSAPRDVHALADGNRDAEQLRVTGQQGQERSNFVRVRQDVIDYQDPT
jgi:hypothetical protein